MNNWAEIRKSAKKKGADTPFIDPGEVSYAPALQRPENTSRPVTGGYTSGKVKRRLRLHNRLEVNRT